MTAKNGVRTIEYGVMAGVYPINNIKQRWEKGNYEDEYRTCTDLKAYEILFDSYTNKFHLI